MEPEPSFWSTLPGLLTALAALIAALTGLFAALHKAGVIGGRGKARADAAQQLARASGNWSATVTYDWGDSHEESFRLTVDGNRVIGSASFLGVMRGIEDGRIEEGRMRFLTRTGEVGGGEASHRYDAAPGDGELRFTMQTSGGDRPYTPVAFVARRVP